MSHQKSSVSQSLQNMSSLQTEPSRMNLQPGVFSSQGIHHSRTPPRTNSGWQRKVDILQRDVINQVKHTSSVDAHSGSMYAQIHAKNLSGVSSKQTKAVVQSQQTMNKSPTSSSRNLKNKLEQQQQQQVQKVSSIIRRNRLSSYSGTSSLGAIKKGLHFVNKSIINGDDSEKRGKDNINNNNTNSSQQHQQGRMLRSSSSSLANGQTQQTENYHTARNLITLPENNNSIKLQGSNGNNSQGRNNGNNKNINESTQPGRLSEQEYALRRETDLIESMLMAGEEQQKHTDISIQNARIKAQNVHLKEAVQSLAGELSILSVKLKEQEENIYQQSTYNQTLQAQLQHCQQLVSKKDDDLKQLSESLQQSKHTYQSELIRFSEQIQKFRHIQELYANEKHTSQTLEKELILKEQQHCDAELELKGVMKYLLQLRDHASRKDQLNQQMIMSLGNNNNNDDSFSFEQESQQHRKQKQDGKDGRHNEEEGYVQCLTIAQKIDQFLQTKQKLLGELDVHYTALQQQQQQSLNQPHSKQQSQQGFLDLPLQTAILLNAKGTKQQQQQSSQIQQNHTDNPKHQVLPSKKGYTKNNSFQQMMQRQMLAPSGQQSGSFQSSQQQQQQSNSSMSALTRSLTENSRKEQQGDEGEIDIGYIPLTSRSKQIQLASQKEEFKQSIIHNNINKDQKQLRQHELPKTSDFNETFQKIGEVVDDANSIEEQDNLTFEMDLETSKVSESRTNGQQQEQQQQQQYNKEQQHQQGNGTNNNCKQSNSNTSNLPVNTTNTLACSSVIEFSNFKHSLEEAIIREGNQHNTPFNSQQLDLSNAVSQYKSQTHEDIELEKNNNNHNTNMNTNSTAECSSAAGSDAEKESRCISLNNRLLKTKESVKVNGGQSSNSKIPLGQHNTINQSKNNSKPPIDFNKDKENKCPNGNSNNNTNQNNQSLQSLTQKQVQTKKNHNESVNINNQMHHNEESTVKKNNNNNNTTKEINQAGETAESKESQKTAICKYSYSAQKEGDLSFQAGDKIHIIKQTKNGWWIGMVNNQIGYFPFNFVEDK